MGTQDGMWVSVCSCCGLLFISSQDCEASPVPSLKTTTPSHSPCPVEPLVIGILQHKNVIFQPFSCFVAVARVHPGLKPE